MGGYQYAGDMEFESEQGEHVTEVQERLVADGKLDEATGTFDEATREALREFSREHGGNPDGGDAELVLNLQEQSGALQSAGWTQKFSDPSATYGHQAPLMERFRDEDQPGNQAWSNSLRTQTLYPEGEEADAYRMDVQDGRFVLADEYLGDGTAAPLDTTEISSTALFHGSKPERMIYTMDAEGELAAADPAAEWRAHPGMRFHHSSLAGGQPVAAAGEIKVRDGQVEAVSDRSGHYEPDLAMTSQMNDRLEAGGVDTSRVTYELGNFPSGQTDTMVTGTELGSYDRESTLADLRSRCWQQAAEAVQAKWQPAMWARLAEDIKQSEIQPVYERLYAPFPQLDDRALLAEARKLIEGRHEAQRTVLDDIRGGASWGPDPSERHQLRWWDGAAWTAAIADNDVLGEDEEGAATLFGVGFSDAVADFAAETDDDDDDFDDDYSDYSDDEDEDEDDEDQDEDEDQDDSSAGGRYRPPTDDSPYDSPPDFAPETAPAPPPMPGARATQPPPTSDDDPDATPDFAPETAPAPPPMPGARATQPPPTTDDDPYATPDELFNPQG
jgi:hypothetical protein